MPKHPKPKCLACLEYIRSYMDVFGSRGIKLNVADILLTHLKLKCNEVDDDVICYKCWKIIKSFHDYYITITKAHDNLKEIEFVKEIELATIKVEVDLDINDTKVEKESTLLLNDIKDENFCDVDDTSAFDRNSFYNPPESPTYESVDALLTTNSLNELSENVDHEHTAENINIMSISDEEESDDSDYNPMEDEKIKIKRPDKRTRERLRMRHKLSSDEYNKNGTTNDQDITKRKPYKFDRKGCAEEELEIQSVVPIKCDICNTAFTSFRGCKTHFHKIHNVAGYLICCNIKFYRKIPLLNHVHKHLYPEGLKCKICEKLLLNKRSLKHHMEVHNDTPQYKCEHCNKTFVRSDGLRLHKLRHGDKIFKCTQCSKAYSTEKLLEKHVIAIHDKAHSYICDICARVFPYRGGLEQHKKHIHHGDKLPPAQCPKCGQWLKHESSLRCHMKRHHGDEDGVKHVCEMCGKESPNSVALYMHKKYVHWSERIHKCHICEKAYKEEKTLKEHLAIHNGIMLYACDFCPKQCNSSASMHKHRKQMHPIEWGEEQKRKSYVKEKE